MSFTQSCSFFSTFKEYKKCRREVFISKCKSKDVAEWAEDALVKYYNPLMKKAICEIGGNESGNEKWSCSPPFHTKRITNSKKYPKWTMQIPFVGGESEQRLPPFAWHIIPNKRLSIFPNILNALSRCIRKHYMYAKTFCAVKVHNHELVRIS